MSTQLGAAPASSPFDGRDASSRSASSRSRAWQAFRLSNQAVQASKPSLSGFGSRRTRSDSQTCQSSSSLSCAGSTPDERCVSWKPALNRTWRPPSKLSTSRAKAAFAQRRRRRASSSGFSTIASRMSRSAATASP